MGELHGQILGMLIVIAVFAAIITPLTVLFTKLINNVDTEVSTVMAEADNIVIGNDELNNKTAYRITTDLMSF